MTDNLILVIAILVTAVIGSYLGRLFSKLKAKSERSVLEAQQEQMRLTIEADSV